MKLHFEPDLDYQLAAIESACDIFRGQETCHAVFEQDLLYDLLLKTVDLALTVPIEEKMIAGTCNHQMRTC